MVDVRVGIVSWNVADLLGDCLRALPAALAGLDVEVVVVDNASEDDSVAVARAAGVEVVPLERNIGYARGMNRALAGTDAPVLVALNPDTIPAPGSLARLVSDLHDHPEVGVCVPRLLDPDGSTQWSLRPFPTLPVAAATNLLPPSTWSRRLRRRVAMPPDDPAAAGPVEWAIGAVHVIRRAAVDDPVAGVSSAAVYRERWFIYVEDLDLCWRLARAGWDTWYDPEATVIHASGTSARQAFGGAARLRWLRETYDWYRLERGWWRVRVYALCNLLGEVARTRHLGPAARQHLRVLVRGPADALSHVPPGRAR